MYDGKQTLKADRERIWHPFTQMRDYEKDPPLVITKGRGVRLFDVEGKAYYDTIASWWTNVHGHSHPYMNRALARQARRLEHVNFSGFTHPWAAELSDRLAAHLPPTLQRFFFSDNGSTAVEVALKMSFQYFQNRGQTAKTRFVYLENGYHGDTVGSVSVGGVDDFHRLFEPLKFQAFRVPSPAAADWRRGRRFTGNVVAEDCPDEVFRPMKELLETRRHEIAAVIVEPLIQCVGQMGTYPAAYLRALETLARKMGIFLIFDEVATGFGRTGKMFALDHGGVAPDFLCLSKGITGGYLPLGATVCTEEVFRAFYDENGGPKTFFHGHSYTANPLGCAAGIASLELFDRERTLERVAETQAYFHRRLGELFDEPWVSDLRYLGLIGAVDLVPGPGRTFAPEARIGQKIYRASLEAGLVLRPLGDTIYWFLPLAVGKKDIEEILIRSRRVIRDAVTSLGASG